jgi:hypothetical protein
MITLYSIRVLQIDAWGNKEDGYEWNNWYTIHTIKDQVFIHRLLNQINRNEVMDYLKANDLIRYSNKLAIEDDGYNIVVLDRYTREPLLALEYGVVM